MNLSKDRPLRLGAAVVAVYVAVAALTLPLTGRHLRPLFEGVGPSVPYHWVKPPPEFAAGNVTPRPTDHDVALTAFGSQAEAVSTSDGQVVLNLPDGAFTPGSADTSVHVRIEPLDPATLAKVPAGLRTNGNAYRLTAEYRPSERAIDALATPGNVIIRVPETFEALLYSPDGRAWTRLQAGPLDPTYVVVGAVFEKFGYYLGAASPSTAPLGQRGAGSNLGVVIIAAVTVVLALGLGLGPVVYRRRRARRRRR